MKSVGAGFEHVVKITNFFVDMSHLPVFFEVRDKFVNTKAPPASTAIQVGRLARDGALFEVEAVAVIPDQGGEARREAQAAPAKKAARKKAPLATRSRESRRIGGCQASSMSSAAAAKDRHLTYVGWTTDVERRLASTMPAPARARRAGGPGCCCTRERFRTRRQAMSREWYLKRDRKFRKQLAQKL